MGNMDADEDPMWSEDHKSRWRRWQCLRWLYKHMSMGKFRHRGACIENVLWEISSRDPNRPNDPRHEVGVELTHFVSAVVNAYGFEERTYVEQQIFQLCQNYGDVATSGLIDWREIVCALHALNNTGHCYDRPMKLLQHFFAIYALPSYTNVVAREDLLTLISIAAITEEELHHTEGALDTNLSRLELSAATAEGAAESALHVGCQQKQRFVQYSTFQRILTVDDPAILSAFQAQIWRRLPSTQKLTYLRLQDEASCQWLEDYVRRYNASKARILWKQCTLVRHYRRWCRYLRRQRTISTQVMIITKRRCKNYIQFWRSYVHVRLASFRKRQIAQILGQKALVQRAFANRWRRWVVCQQRIRHAVGVPKKYQKNVAQGCYYLRTARKFSLLRRALTRWSDTIVWIRQWETACRVARRLQITWHFRAFKAYYLQRRSEKIIERDCVQRQMYLQRILQEADQIRRETEANVAARNKAEEHTQQERRKSEHRDNLAWAMRRRAAARAFQDRMKSEIQKEERAKQVEVMNKEREDAFKKKWDQLEIDRVDTQRAATLEWLTSKQSKSTILKEFKRIRREFFQPPTPRSMDREAKLKSLASIVLIRIEAILFQKHLLLEDVIRQYDKKSRGYLSHDEFKRLVDDLPVDLSAEQVRQIIREIDSDDDGYINLAELENALEGVHRYNGLAASPWRQYIDPAQDVMCYTNLTTGESILEHRMTNRKLMEITRSNFLAETELADIKQVRQDRAEAWEALVNDDAVARIQRMYRRFRARQELKRLNWKIQAKVKKDRELRCGEAALHIQQWYRKCLADWIYGLAILLHVEAIPDLNNRILYYYNHTSGSSSWEPPPKPVHRPQDFVGTGPYVQWDVPLGRPLRRMFQKPPGYPLCTRCLQSLALLQCDTVPGVYCFSCFRQTVDVRFLRENANTAPLKRVSKITCSYCAKHDAAWRCTMDAQQGGKLIGRVACAKCQPRLHVDKKLAWIRI